MSNHTDHPQTSSHDHTYVERTEKRGGGGTGIALLVGGLVVAVGVLAWIIYGGFDAGTATGGSDVNVNVESSEGAVDDAAGAVESAAGAVEDAADSTAGAAEGAAEGAADEATTE